MNNELLNTFECRICFEDDQIKNMIVPCLCNGTNKYVHEKCLKKFILSSNNLLYKKQCYICKYEYNFDVNIDLCNNYSLFLFLLNIFGTFFILLYIYFNIYSIFYNILLIFYINLPFIVNVILLKRKKIILKLYIKEYIYIPIFLIFVSIYLLQFNILNIYAFFLENIAALFMWNIHYKSLYILYFNDNFKIIPIEQV